MKIQFSPSDRASTYEALRPFEVVIREGFVGKSGKVIGRQSVRILPEEARALYEELGAILKSAPSIAQSIR